MSTDPLLLKFKPISEITTVDNPTEGHLLFYDGGDELKKVDIVEFQSLIGGGRNHYKKNSPITPYAGLTFQRYGINFPEGIFVVGSNNYAGEFRIHNVINSNGWWTISWDMRGSQSVAVGVDVDICDLGIQRFNTTTDNTWKRFSLSVNVTNYGDGSIYNFVDFSRFSWAYFYIKNIKIEQGNKATDWTPAPEDKQDSLQNITGYIGVGKPDASATEKLDVNGRTKSDGQVFNETSSAILPREIKFKDGKFKAALSDGVEKSVLLEGDVSGSNDFSSLNKLLFNENFMWQKPNFGNNTYQSFGYGTTIAQFGHTNEGGGIGSYKSFGITYVSSTTSLAYFRGSSSFLVLNGNSELTRRFSIDTTVSTQRVYIGISDNYRQFNPTNVQLDTIFNFIAICMESGNSNLLLMHNDGSGTATVIDTGFTHSTNYFYEVSFSNKAYIQEVKVVLKRISIIDGSINTFTHTITNNYVYPLIEGRACLAIWCVDSLGVSQVKVTDYGGSGYWRYKTFNS